ncbi:MAG: hypothetical protein VW230_00480 [Candidatus Poseidoniales archaeon]
MAVRVDWDRQPVSIHANDSDELEQLIQFLRSKYNCRKHSVIMRDREHGEGYLFFVYQNIDPRWIVAFQQGEGSK